jgi:hypothetical protein
VNQFYRREPRTNIWPDIGSRFATVKLVHQSEIYHKSSPPPRVGRLHLHWCRPTRLRLMGALSLTRRKPRGRSGLHSTPGLASTVLTRRLAPAWGIFARRVPGVVPRRCTPGFPSVPTSGVRSPVIHQPSRTANQYLARYWFAVRDGKIGSPVRDLSDGTYEIFPTSIVSSDYTFLLRFASGNLNVRHSFYWEGTRGHP